MNTDTRIFGYTDGMNVYPHEDDIVLCPSDGAKYFEAASLEWRIMRAYDRPAFIYHKCDDCQKMIFPVMVEDTTKQGRNMLDNDPDPRLEVFAKYLETLVL